MGIDIDQLEHRALAGDVTAVRQLAAAARSAQTSGQRYRVTTEDGLTRVLTVQEYLSATATDLARSKVELVRE